MKTNWAPPKGQEKDLARYGQHHELLANPLVLSLVSSFQTDLLVSSQNSRQSLDVIARFLLGHTEDLKQMPVEVSCEFQIALSALKLQLKTQSIEAIIQSLQVEQERLLHWLIGKSQL